jgi:spermidine synthase
MLLRLCAFSVILAAVIVLLPNGQTLWARLHSASPQDVLYAEDGAGLALLKAERPDFSGNVGVFVNGLGQSWIPFGRVHSALGALPALIHPAPSTIVIIGLGSGDTAFSAAARTETRRLISVEIIGAQVETLRELTRLRAYPALMSLLSDPRIEHRADDGRAYVLQSPRQFDIIEADALRPGSAYAGNLYSREYFQLLQGRLAPGGIAVTWAPTERTARTFASVFPYVLRFRDIYLGSDSPIPFDPAVVAARAAAVRPYFDAAGVDIVSLVKDYLPSATAYGPADRRELGDLNTDAFPRDELALPFR